MKIAANKRSISPFLIYLPAVLAGLLIVSWVLAGLQSSGGFSSADQYLDGSLNRTGANTGLLIEDLQDRLQADPDDWQAYSQLGLAYLQKARETGDPTYYQKAGEAIERSLSLEPEDYVSTSAAGALALARHDFHAALDWGERARKINPNRP
ncbi:MAG: hypothetical protein EHM70_11445 [Chloroflexota bacterium]|nr:MAG: hypothetical protein EHM70_11445 [Chloroflexota bacterium]